jgi:hypothetical protein
LGLLVKPEKPKLLKREQIISLTLKQGITSWEIFDWGAPYAGMSNQSVAEFVPSGGRLQVPSAVKIPVAAWRALCWCWQATPEERPTFRELAGIFEEIQKQLEAGEPVEMESKAEKLNQKIVERSESEEEHYIDPIGKEEDS